MSTRRSARVQAQPKAEDPVVKVNGTSVASKKRGRKSETSNTSKLLNAADKTTIINGQNGSTAMLPPPTTPNKRRRTAKDESKPPPLTPTPSAVGLMINNNRITSYSSGDVDDVPPPVLDRPAEPHRTNAILVTPHGTQLQPSYSSLNESPSKPGPNVSSARCILDEACAHLIRVDPKLKPVIDQMYCHVFSPAGMAEVIDPFRSLSSGIMGQQVSGAAARSIKNKFIGLFPEEACRDGFPTPKAVAETSLPRLREAGLSQRKAEYIQGLAEKFVSGELTAEMLLRATDEEVMESLIAVRGLGKWSVEMFMCFGLKRMDIFSTGDLGIQRGMAAQAGRDVAKLKNKGGKWKYMTEQEMLERSEPYRPYRSVYMWYLWRVEDVDVSAIQDN